MLFYGLGLLPAGSTTAPLAPTRLVIPTNPTPPPPPKSTPSGGTVPSTGTVQPVSTTPTGGGNGSGVDTSGLLPYTDPNGVTCLRDQMNLATGYCPGSSPPTPSGGDNGAVCPEGTAYDPSVGGCTSTGPATVDVGGGPSAGGGGSSGYTDPNGVSCDPSMADPTTGLCPGAAMPPAGPTVTLSPVAPTSVFSSMSKGSKIVLAVLGLGAAGLGIAAIGRRSRRAA